MAKGSCLCGAVSFTVDGPLGPPGACHCTQCRKQTGHYWASSEVPRRALTINGAALLTWYQSSEQAQRGFCSRCGSFLFWDRPAHECIEIAMGALDTPTETQLRGHIFVADKGDYYTIDDGLPQTP